MRALRRRLGGPCHRARFGVDAGERRLGGRGPQGRGAHVGEPDPGLGEVSVVPPDERRHADHRPGLRDPLELLVVEAPALGRRDLHPHQQFVGAQRGLQIVEEELAGRDRAPPLRSHRDQGRVEREDHGGQVTGRIGVCERTAEGAAMAYGGIGDRGGGRRQESGVPAHQRIADDVVVRGHRADDQRAGVLADPAQLGDPADVDDQFGEGEPQPEQGQQALPAGQHLRVLARVREGAHGLVDARGPRVVECGGIMPAPPLRSGRTRRPPERTEGLPRPVVACRASSPRSLRAGAARPRSR